MRRVLIFALLVTTVPVPVTAQTTPTERSAAKPVLDQIDRLQKELSPTAMGDRL